MALGIGVIALLGTAGGVSANPVDGRYIEDPRCDDFGPLIAIEELGNSPLFATDERIDAAATFTQEAACIGEPDDPGLPNALVVMTNLTGRTWTDLFYVGDVQTLFTNVDGFATSDEAPPPGSFLTLAFRIDALGLNRPLVFESFAADGIFVPGETWHFIIQDYTNTLGLPAGAMGSLDFAGGSFADPMSSGSIVQFIVPAPGSAGLAATTLALGIRRRR
jgi:hypothetical protein